jgi:hypothetical protein
MSFTSIDIFWFPGERHLNPMIALARRLYHRRRAVTFFQITEVEPIVSNAGLDFRTIGERYLAGTWVWCDRSCAEVGERQEPPFELSFNGSLRFDFQGAQVTSDGGLLLVPELDERLGLGEVT